MVAVSGVCLLIGAGLCVDDWMSCDTSCVGFFCNVRDGVKMFALFFYLLLNTNRSRLPLKKVALISLAIALLKRHGKDHRNPSDASLLGPSNHNGIETATEESGR